MNAIERVIVAVAICPRCNACPYADYSCRYGGDCKLRREKDAKAAMKILGSLERTEEQE